MFQTVVLKGKLEIEKHRYLMSRGIAGKIEDYHMVAL